MPAASCHAQYSRRLYRLGCEQTALSNYTDDLNSRAVEKPAKGIYIINGKKVLVK